MSLLRVGHSTVEITPEPGLPLMGNFRDDYAARGTHDPLRARALVFADAQGEKAGLLAVDVCMLDRQNVALLRDVIGAECDVPPANVLIHATHTHSAPATSGRLGMATEIAPHTRAIETLLRNAGSAIVAANQSLEVATLEVGGTREEHVSFNRRLRRPDGTTQMNWEALQEGFDPTQVEGAWGPIDPEMICLVARSATRSIAALVNFALHPAILAGDNWLYSADYPGTLLEALSQSLGTEANKSANGFFLNGCCGNVNHVDYRAAAQQRGHAMVQQVGSTLATRAHQAIQSSSPVATDRLLVSRKLVQLDRLEISDRERDRCVQILKLAQQHPPQGQVDGLPDAYFAKLRLEMWQAQDQPDFAEVMVIRLGDVAVVGLPGEAFCELGLEIKRRSPSRYTLVAGLCNDAIGYLPTEQAFQRGGYETMVGSTFYKPGSAERLVESAVTQLGQLFASPRRTW